MYKIQSAIIYSTERNRRLGAYKNFQHINLQAGGYVPLKYRESMVRSAIGSADINLKCAGQQGVLG